jgi:hypothetical protein
MCLSTWCIEEKTHVPRTTSGTVGCPRCCRRLGFSLRRIAFTGKEIVSRARESSTFTHRGSECQQAASRNAGKKLGVVVHGGWWVWKGRRRKNLGSDRCLVILTGPLQRSISRVSATGVSCSTCATLTQHSRHTGATHPQ